MPVEETQDAVSRILGLVPTPRRGLGIRAAGDAWSRELGLPGVLVLEVLPGGPGECAGLRPTRTSPSGDLELGDLIVALDGQAIRSGDGLARALARVPRGSSAAVTIRRGEEELEIQVIPELE